MKNIINITGIFLFIAFLFFLQQSRLFEIKGVNPNLFLVALFLYAYYGRVSFQRAILFSVAMGLFIFYTFPFFGIWGIIALLLFIVSVFFRDKITGNRFTDFMLVLVFGSLLFSLITESIFNLKEFGLNFGAFFFVTQTFLFGEILYGVVIGGIAWFILLKTIRISRRISKI